jgi:hypothetical protein
MSRRNFVRLLREPRIVACFLGFLLHRAPVTAQPQHEELCSDSKWCEKGPAVWCETGNELSVKELARKIAPTLWFSRDEPLLGKVNKETWGLPPHRLPGDIQSQQGTVYYQLSKVSPSNSSGGEKLQLGEAEEATVTFYFYYQEDIGTGHHKHDLEKADFRVKIERCSSVPQKRIRVDLVEVAAHGVLWYSNRLRLKEDDPVEWPVTLLVEEGKHASAPDRNGDGFYTPGWDVNDRVNEAWGVRDVMGAEQLLSPDYDASMTKPRTESSSHRAFPKTSSCVPSKLTSCYELVPARSYHGVQQRDCHSKGLVAYLETSLKLENNERSSTPSEEKKSKLLQNKEWLLELFATDRYKGNTGLSEEDEQRLDEIEKNDGLLPDEDKKLVRFFEKHNFGCEPNEYSTWHHEFMENFVKNPKTGLLNARFDAKSLGVTYVWAWGIPRIPQVGWWVLPKFSWTFVNWGQTPDVMSLGAHFTPSAAQFVDWYFWTGWEWRDPWDEKFTQGLAYEGGIRFRFNWETLINEFWGVRVGVRTSGRGQHTRFILEFLGGSW